MATKSSISDSGLLPGHPLPTDAPNPLTGAKRGSPPRISLPLPRSPPAIPSRPGAYETPHVGISWRRVKGEEDGRRLVSIDSSRAGSRRKIEKQLMGLTNPACFCSPRRSSGPGVLYRSNGESKVSSLLEEITNLLSLLLVWERRKIEPRARGSSRFFRMPCQHRDSSSFSTCISVVKIFTIHGIRPRRVSRSR
ncbi:hypothetical protein CALVIDRAFT_533379 [Calocera viscosa TUFC12733]|uniref:Uncharacterized protein n=1 Tax=Calocera viscosa (strain TUFC12733) TaxID=1330018 RepID=A0A167QY20_CALVF|nr:hypothetical protein CALVIDRAFT_533379 [Calocera viscosa TUFC12733]